MNACIDKDERISFLEDTVRRLLKERSEWGIKCHELESKLRALDANTGAIVRAPLDDQGFLNQVGELIRPMIHEVNSLLYPVAAGIERTLRSIEDLKNAEDINKIKKSLIVSNQSLERIRRFITDMAYLGGKAPGNYSRIKLNELIIENVTNIQERFKDFNIELNLEKDPLEIFGNKELLNQIINNLVINALEASSTSTCNISISTQKYIETTPPHVKIIVKDNGVGMSPSEISRIYDLHYTTKKTGFGIGLHLVKRAVEYHKGKIDCESNPGKGTTFVVTLPEIKEEKNNVTN